MKFFLDIEPPTATAQMKKVSIVNGRPVFYEPAAVKAAKKVLLAALTEHVPEGPLTGALLLHAVWLYPAGKSHKAGTWRVTRPDTDNIEKLLKDCMTKCGFWKDDAQVVKEIVEKRWSDEPTGIQIEIVELGTAAGNISVPATDLPGGSPEGKAAVSKASETADPEMIGTAAGVEVRS